MKTNLITIMMLFSIMISAQIGVGTTTPQATLDVTGKPADATVPEGVIAPRLTGDQLAAKDAAYTIAQKGTLVYVTSRVTVPTPKTANVNSEGYYFFDGTVWNTVTSPGPATKIATMQVGEVGIKPNTPFPYSGMPAAKKMYFSSQSTQTGSMYILSDPGAWDPVDQSYTVPSNGVYTVDVNFSLSGCNPASGGLLFITYVFLLKNGASQASLMKLITTPAATGVGGELLRCTFMANTGDKIYIVYAFNDNDPSQYCNQIQNTNDVRHTLTITKHIN